MAQTLQQPKSDLEILKDLYFSDANVVEITDAEEAKKYARSKTSASWCSDKVLNGGWVHLSQSSPSSKGANFTVLVCRAGLLSDIHTEMLVVSQFEILII